MATFPATIKIIIDDVHDRDELSFLVADLASTLNYEGFTGRFESELHDGYPYKPEVPNCVHGKTMTEKCNHCRDAWAKEQAKVMDAHHLLEATKKTQSKHFLYPEGFVDNRDATVGPEAIDGIELT